MKKQYIKKDGTISLYNYPDKKYQRNNEIYQLQKRKSYYKKLKRFDVVEGIDLQIAVLKRREKTNENS